MSKMLDFYRGWAELLEWMRGYAAQRDGVKFTVESDFTDYIYRMERPYDLPTTVMVASLSDLSGRPVLMVNSSQRAAVFKEVVLHPVDSHVYRKLTLAKEGEGLAEGRRRFTKAMLYDLADDLFRFERGGVAAAAALVADGRSSTDSTG